MKKFTNAAVFAVIVSFALILTSCGGSSSQGPEAVAEKYVAAMQKQDFATMKKYVSEREIANITEQEEEAKNMPAEKKELFKAIETAKIEVQPAVINEATPNVADVDIKYTMTFEGEENDGVWKAKLIKEGNDWKVDSMSWK